MRPYKLKAKLLLGVVFVISLLALIAFALVPLTPLNWERYMQNNYINYFAEFNSNQPSRSIPWRLERRFIQYTIIRELHDRMGLRLAPATAQDEIEAMRNGLLAFRSYVRSQSEIPHRMLDCPAIVSGLGWCNQINEDAAIWLAQEFDVCYVVAIYDSKTKLGHTIGRVKSRIDGQWIYFDAWPAEPCLFKVTLEGKLDYQPPAADVTATPERDVDFQFLDALAEHSPITGTFPRSYFGYLAARMSRNNDSRTVEEGTIDTEKLLPPADHDQLRIYVKARMAHLKGDQSKAMTLYEASANFSKSESKSVLGAAAESFCRAASYGVQTGLTRRIIGKNP
jgi:hypothetical protein